LALASPARAVSANERLIVGAIGCGGRGTFLAASFAGHPDVEVAWVCDPDDERTAACAESIRAAKGNKPKTARDLREVLDDKSVDAVTVATPDHWHGPATLLALDAGKHVYVEKPCGHNIREGRLMVEAARRNNKVVQTGTQTRAGESAKKAMQLLHDGAIGDVLVAKVWNSQLRSNIGKAGPSEPPGGFDYDLWLGPIPQMPFQVNRHHYYWHWWYATGTGDMGNDGVHDLDVGRWGLGVETHPSGITAIGGKYVFDDDQQFPDTQSVIFEWPGDGQVGSRRQLIFEMRIWAPYREQGYENGNAFYGTKGMMLFGKGDGWKLFGPRNQLIEEGQSSERDVAHQRSFVECIMDSDHPRPTADIEIGHYSAALCHLGNLACRVGRPLKFDPAKEEILGDDEANSLCGREYREGHWAVPKA
jgi:predicted dehydrogenase